MTSCRVHIRPWCAATLHNNARTCTVAACPVAVSISGRRVRCLWTRTHNHAPSVVAWQAGRFMRFMRFVRAVRRRSYTGRGPYLESAGQVDHGREHAGHGRGVPGEGAPPGPHPQTHPRTAHSAYSRTHAPTYARTHSAQHVFMHARAGYRGERSWWRQRLCALTLSCHP